MTVSIIEIGAGSRGVSARPSLPTTDSISGISWKAMSCFCSTSRASPMEAWAMVVGIHRYEPSSRFGMNSLPSPGKR